MNPRELVVVAAVAAVALRLLRDANKGGVAEVRRNARSYLAIGLAAGAAGLAVEVFPPAGVTAAGLLVITVALSSAKADSTDGTFFGDFFGRIFLSPGQIAAGAAAGGAVGATPPGALPGGGVLGPIGVPGGVLGPIGSPPPRVPPHVN